MMSTEAFVRLVLSLSKSAAPYEELVADIEKVAEDYLLELAALKARVAKLEGKGSRELAD